MEAVPARWPLDRPQSASRIAGPGVDAPDLVGVVVGVVSRDHAVHAVVHADREPDQTGRLGDVPALVSDVETAHALRLEHRMAVRADPALAVLDDRREIGFRDGFLVLPLDHGPPLVEAEHPARLHDGPLHEPGAGGRGVRDGLDLRPETSGESAGTYGELPVAVAESDAPALEVPRTGIHPLDDRVGRVERVLPHEEADERGVALDAGRIGVRAMVRILAEGAEHPGAPWTAVELRVPADGFREGHSNTPGIISIAEISWSPRFVTV